MPSTKQSAVRALLLAIPFLTLATADRAGADPAGGVRIPDVPYLSQTEALCGGASAAMLFRYWGQRHADVQQFAALVDRRAGGIAVDVLERAIAERGWTTERPAPTIEAIRERLVARQPVMLLIEDRPRRYHFVVAVGLDADAIEVHDPAWGPSRQLPLPEFATRWRAAQNWALVVRPADEREAKPVVDRPVAASANAAPRAAAGTVTSCDRRLNAALDVISAKGLDVADDVLGALRQACPGDSRAYSELAGVRVAQRRPAEAARLAAEATRLDPSNRYAWDVLGSSRFIQNEYRGALEAWNHVEKPMLDSVRIGGLSRTRYALIAEWLGLTPNALLTASAFTSAERRLEQLPDRSSARIAFRPDADGFAVVDVAIVERALRPRGAIAWAAAAAQTLTDRELAVTVPGRTGQGETWTGAWRWWSNRPRAALTFAAPRVGVWTGLWTVSAFWEAQTYAIAAADGGASDAVIREERTHVSAGVSDWLLPNLRYAATAGVDAWNGQRRTISAGGELEQRLFDDHVTLDAAAAAYAPVSGGAAFRAGTLGAGFQSSREPAGWVLLAAGGAHAASAQAPLALWSGAGEGRARTPLLRAHPLVDNGIVTGDVFGRRVGFGTVEVQRWLARPALAHVGAAAFVDAARADLRTNVARSGITTAAARDITARDRAGHIDAGVGVRLQAPGRAGMLRVDYAHGLDDGADAVTVGWVIGLPGSSPR